MTSDLPAFGPFAVNTPNFGMIFPVKTGAVAPLWVLVQDARCAGDTEFAEQCHAAVHLDAGDGVVLGFGFADFNDANTRGAGGGQTCDAVRLRAIVESAGDDGRSSRGRTLHLVDWQEIVAEDRNVSVDRDLFAGWQLNDVTDRGAAEGTQESVVSTDRTGRKHEVIDLAVFVFDLVDQLVHDVERQVLTVRSRRDFLTGWDQGQDAGERVARTVADDHVLLILATDRLGFRSDLDGCLVLDVTACSLDQAIDFSVTDDGGQSRRHLREGRCGFGGDGAIDAEELRIAHGVFAIVSQRITVDVLERHHFEDGVDVDDRFDHASVEQILGEFCGFRECYRSHDRPFNEVRPRIVDLHRRADCMN